MCNFAQSSVQHILQPIDCRRLTLSVQYYFLDQDAACALTGDILKWIEEVTEENFLFRWYHNGKAVAQKKVMTTLYWPIADVGGLRLGFDAYVLNPAMKNSAAIVRYQKSLRSIYPEYVSRFQIPPFADECSVDYPEYLDALFPCARLKNSQIIDNILEIFHTPDRKQLSFHQEPDFTGRIQAIPYAHHPGLYYGTVTLSFGAFCLGASLDKMADILVLLACELSETYGQLNAHVCLQPKGLYGTEYISPYMRYFGKHLQEDGSCEEAQCNAKEWYPVYYLSGVEWLNILSPLTKKHIGELPERLSPEIEARMLASGGLLVKSAKPITEYTVVDALALKNIIRPALYSGKVAVPLRSLYPWTGSSRVYAWCPRSDWAIVPVERMELDIIGTDIVFSSKR